MFGKVAVIGSVLWSLPRMGSILGTSRSHTRFCGGLPQRGVEKICRTGYFVNGFENLVVLKYWLVSGIPPGMGFDFCFWKGYFWNLKWGLEIRIKYMWKILSSRMYQKICGLDFELFLRGEMLLAELIKVWVVLGKTPWDILTYLWK